MNLMAIEVQWYNDEQTILIWRLIDTWDWEEFHDAHKQLNALIESVDHNVSVIVDSRKNITMPTNIILHMQQALQLGNTKAHVYVVVGMNLLTKTFYNTLINGILAPYKQANRLFAVSTMDEALEIIRSRI